MMKMKLRATGGENHRCDLNSVNGTDRPGRRESARSAPLDKEAVFEWFGLQLSPAGRVELLCGLLHMCQPLELRFLGACLEDLARRDFTVLRDFETRANCPADLEGLVDVDVSDPVVLSKLLVYVSLLGSKSRECAGILFRTLSRIEAGMCGALPEPETVDQLRLLFTMGSLHPAFSFHQREELRAQLDRLQEWSMFSRPRFICPQQENEVDWTLCSDPNPHLSSRSQREVVHIEMIVLKDVSVAGDSRQYTFEVKWSDSSLTAVTKSHRELEDFLLKLPKEQSPDGFEKSIVRLLNRSEQCEVRELERNLREKFLSLSPDVLQRCDVSTFFLSDPSSLPCRCCTRAPVSRIHQPARGFSEDCSETSSLEEGETDVEGYSVRAAGLSNPHSECQRRGNCEQNGERVRMKGTECEQGCTNDRRILTPGPKSKGRSAGKRERGRRATSVKTSAGIQKPSATLMSNQTACKDAGRVRYGDTSSESSNSVPSSPVHHKSLEDQDTESQSDNSAQEPEKTHPAKGIGGKAVAMVNPLVAEPQNVMQPPSVVEFALTCLPYTMQYNPTQRDTNERKITITIPLPREPGTSSASTHPQQQPPLGAFGILSGAQCSLQHANTTANSHIKTNTKASTLSSTSSRASSSCQIPGPCPTTVPTHTPGPGPMPPPAVTHSTGPSDSLSYINSSNLPVTPQTQAGTTQQHQHQGGCNACGCRGSCGGNVTHQSLGYFLPPQPARQMFGPPPPFFHLQPSSFTAQGHQNNGTPLPFYAHTGPPAAFLHAPSDHMLASQAGYSLPQMPTFRRFYQPQHVFQPVGLMSGGTNMKKTANVSCYNCGMSGHYAQECKQPSIDAGMTGGFRLKYVGPNSSDSLDKND